MSKERELLALILSYAGNKYLTVDEFEMMAQIEETFKEIQELLAQPEQEEAPVATKLEGHQFTAFHVSADDFKKLQKLPTGTKIYTAPPKREPLSDEAIAKLWGESYSGTTQRVRNFARAIEQQHGIGGGK